MLLPVVESQVAIHARDYIEGLKDSEKTVELQKLRLAHFFLAVADIGKPGLFRSIDPEEAHKPFLSYNFAIEEEDIEFLVFEAKTEQTRFIVFFIVLNEGQKNSPRYFFKKSLKYFHPHPFKKKFAAVNSKTELAHYSMLSQELRLPNDNLETFLLLFANNTQTTVPHPFKETMTFFSIISKRWSLKTCGGETAKLTNEPKPDSGQSLQDVYEHELPQMEKFLRAYEQSGYRFGPIKSFRNVLRNDFITAESFLLQNQNRLKVLENLIRRKPTPTMISNTTLTYFNTQTNLLVSQDLCKKKIRFNDSNQKQLMITQFYMDEAIEFFQQAEHVFIDASWFGSFMVVPIVSYHMETHNEYIYKTLMIFVIERTDLHKTVKGTKCLYIELLRLVKEKCCFIKSATSDFEKAILHSIDHYSLERWGCYFHYVQALRRRCIDKQKRVSNECLQILKVLPFVHFNHIKSEMNKMSKTFKHLPDCEMFEYVRREYFPNLLTFSKNIINDQSNEYEYFKLTSNPVERVFRWLKQNRVPTDKDQLFVTILKYFQRKYVNPDYVGQQKKAKAFRISKLSHIYQAASQELDQRLLTYQTALVNNNLKAISKVSFSLISKHNISNNKDIHLQLEPLKREKRAKSEKLSPTSAYRNRTATGCLSKRNLDDISTKVSSMTSDQFVSLKRVKDLHEGFKTQLQANSNKQQEEIIRLNTQIKEIQNENVKQNSELLARLKTLEEALQKYQQDKY